MKRITATQIPPECQESPLQIFGYDGTIYENIIFTGNSDYIGHTTPEYDLIIQNYEEAAEELENLGTQYGHYSNATEIINDYFPADYFRIGEYSTQDVHQIREVLELYGTRKYYEGDYIPLMLSALTGGSWMEYTITGYCQRDWEKVILDSDAWTPDDLEIIESDYFNLGTEWTIHDDDDPDSKDDFTIYCYSDEPENLRKQIADETGTAPENITLRMFAGYTKTASYMEV